MYNTSLISFFTFSNCLEAALKTAYEYSAFFKFPGSKQESLMTWFSYFGRSWANDEFKESKVLNTSIHMILGASKYYVAYSNTPQTSTPKILILGALDHLLYKLVFSGIENAIEDDFGIKDNHENPKLEISNPELWGITKDISKVTSIENILEVMSIKIGLSQAINQGSLYKNTMSLVLISSAFRYHENIVKPIVEKAIDYIANKNTADNKTNPIEYDTCHPWSIVEEYLS